MKPNNTNILSIVFFLFFHLNFHLSFSQSGFIGNIQYNQFESVKPYKSKVVLYNKLFETYFKLDINQKNIKKNSINNIQNYLLELAFIENDSNTIFSIIKNYQSTKANLNYNINNTLVGVSNSNINLAQTLYEFILKNTTDSIYSNKLGTFKLNVNESINQTKAIYQYNYATILYKKNNLNESYLQSKLAFENSEGYNLKINKFYFNEAFRKGDYKSLNQKIEKALQDEKVYFGIFDLYLKSTNILGIKYETALDKYKKLRLPFLQKVKNIVGESMKVNKIIKYNFENKIRVIVFVNNLDSIENNIKALEQVNKEFLKNDLYFTFCTKNNLIAEKIKLWFNGLNKNIIMDMNNNFNKLFNTAKSGDIYIMSSKNNLNFKTKFEFGGEQMLINELSGALLNIGTIY